MTARIPTPRGGCGSEGRRPSCRLFPALAAFTAALAAGACGATSTTSVGPSPVKCDISLPVPSRAIGAAGGTVAIAVAAQPECTWNAATQTNWLSGLSPSSGQGAAQIAVRASSNAGPERTGIVTVEGQTFTLTQAGGCAYTVGPTSHAFTKDGATASVSVATIAGCQWTATRQASWITVTSAVPATGTADLNFTVDANDGPQRSSTLTVAGRSITVTQASGCTYSVAPLQHMVSWEDGGIMDVTITTAPDCPWAVASNDGWIVLLSSVSGTGSDTVSFFVSSLPPPPIGIGRSGSLTVAGQTVDVFQDR